MNYLRIIAANEQDRAEFADWWRDSTAEDKATVWEAIQRRYDDPVMEIVSRLAQLAFAELAERELREKEAG